MKQMTYMQQMKYTSDRRLSRMRGLRIDDKTKKSPLDDVFEAHAEVDDAHVPGLEQIK